MSKTINISIRDRKASLVSGEYICGNNDITVTFDFDEEWQAAGAKTARFLHNGKFHDVVFTGNTCTAPLIMSAYNLKVGVFAGNLRTTTPAYIHVVKSILSSNGAPADPEPDVYAQIMDLLSKGGASAEQIQNAVQDYLEKNPPQGVSDEHIRSVTEDLLEEAKASGEFNGKDGNDYVLTEADKKEIADMIEVPSGPGGTIPDNVLTTDDVDEITAAVISALPIYNGEVVSE